MSGPWMMVVSVIPIWVVWEVRCSPEPWIAEPRVPEYACYPPEPWVIVPASPVPRVIVVHPAPVIPRASPDAYIGRAVICPWICAVVDVCKRVIRNGNRSALLSIEMYHCRLAVRYDYGVFPVPEKEQAGLFASCYEILDGFVRDAFRLVKGLFRPVIDSVLILLSGGGVLCSRTA